MSNLLPNLSPLHHITVSTSPDAPYTSTLHRQPRLQHQDQLRLLPREWCALCIVCPQDTSMRTKKARTESLPVLSQYLSL